jgi:hypothetical protein
MVAGYLQATPYFFFPIKKRRPTGGYKLAEGLPVSGWYSAAEAARGTGFNGGVGQPDKTASVVDPRAQPQLIQNLSI